MRSIYTLVSHAISDLPYLKPAVALVLGFVGGKMFAEFFHYDISVGASLAVVSASGRASSECMFSWLYIDFSCFRTACFVAPALVVGVALPNPRTRSGYLAAERQQWCARPTSPLSRVGRARADSAACHSFLSCLGLRHLERGGDCQRDFQP